MTKDDLDQIKQLLGANNKELQQDFQKRLEENNKQLRQDITANNKQLRQELREDIKAEVAPLHERLDALREQINRVEKKLLRATEDFARMIREVVFPKLEQHDNDIAQLQETVGLKPRKQ